MVKSTIYSVNDLILSEEYYISLLPKSKTYKVIYLGCVKTISTPSFYFKFLERKGFKDGISFFGINEIGIGNSREEAKISYAKLKNQLPEKYLDDPKLIPELENHPAYR